MSENLEDLLDVDADEENEGDYDLGDDEEDALLDDNFEKLQASSKNRVEQDHEPEPDFVLELDDGTELNDEDDAEISLNTSSLNIEEDQKRNRKTDKFTNERVVLNVDVSQHSRKLNQNDGKNFGDRQNQRGFQFRGRGRGGSRGNYQNEQNRNAQYHQKKKVLINPHFKGNVQIRNNVSLAWDSNHANNQNNQHKKPLVYIHPWAQNQQPVLNNYMQQQSPEPHPIINTFSNPPYQPLPQMNLKPPVHQRLGVNPNLCNIDSQQYQVQFPPQQLFQQVPPNHMYEQVAHLSNYNNAPPQFNHQQMFHKLHPPPVYNQPPNYSNIQTNAYPNPPNYNNAFQNSMFMQPSGNEYNVYPQPVPVHNIDTTPQIANYHKPTEYMPHQKQYQQQQPRMFNQGSPGKRKFDVKGDLKKKKRNLPSNLHEVQTVDVTPEMSVKSEVVEEEDEEMRAYRLKIEQQKMIREKILQQKEERRKQAAKKLQAEEEYKTVVPPNELIKNIEIPVITNVQVQPKVVKAAPRVSQNIVPIKTVSVNELGSSNSGRVVVANSKKDEEPFHLNPFLSNRKVFAKDQSLADTPVVVVSNLATGTSVAKLRKLCQGVGDIQNLQMSTQERQATIQFKSVASAHAFYKKYQRFMLDLSMIQKYFYNMDEINESV